MSKEQRIAAENALKGVQCAQHARNYVLDFFEEYPILIEELENFKKTNGVQFIDVGKAERHISRPILKYTDNHHVCLFKNK